MNILSIETSCDETSIAITQNGKKILSNIIVSQVKYHKKFGGVVPEIASRKHSENITLILKEALDKSKLKIQEIDLIAVTQGPGLISSLFVGINAANTLAYIYQKPLIGVNHLIGHIYSAQIENDLKFPSLVLLISGGHTELIYMSNHFNLKTIGSTLDDAVGEVYDKIARNLNLSYPGGPIIEKTAKKGEDIFHFTRPYLKNKNLNFSFSGLKSQIINFISQKPQDFISKNINNICASFQESISDVLIEKIKRAIAKFYIKQLIIVGGVASNKFLQKKIKNNFKNLEIIIPSQLYCTDQAAMIGIAAFYQYKIINKIETKYNLKENYISFF
ncbi:tRNA (adenosine(37)-N6)-threonylcarbamoyltransferase complex transferase subunit TsaD [Candidatus Phytoplasma palmae]